MKKLSAAFGSLPMTWPVVCVNHCRSSFWNAEEVENKDSVGGNDCTADSRCYYLGCAQ